jgi:hypothetical protein
MSLQDKIVEFEMKQLNFQKVRTKRISSFVADKNSEMNNLLL